MTRNGRPDITNRNGSSGSSRAKTGKLIVEKGKQCPNCGHDKTLYSSYSGIEKCSRCGFRHDQVNKTKIKKK